MDQNSSTGEVDPGNGVWENLSGNCRVPGPFFVLEISGIAFGG